MTSENPARVKISTTTLKRKTLSGSSTLALAKTHLLFLFDAQSDPLFA
jgi:hypothetical protein